MMKSRTKGSVIRCGDCGEHGYIALPSRDERYLSYGWKIVYLGWFRYSFICPNCQAKRRRWVAELRSKTDSPRPTPIKQTPAKNSKWKNLQAFDLDF